jgi:hypothetical protein
MLLHCRCLLLNMPCCLLLLRPIRAITCITVSAWRCARPAAAGGAPEQVPGQPGQRTGRAPASGPPRAATAALLSATTTTASLHSCWRRRRLLPKLRLGHKRLRLPTSARHRAAAARLRGRSSSTGLVGRGRRRRKDVQPRALGGAARAWDVCCCRWWHWLRCGLCCSTTCWAARCWQGPGWPLRFLLLLLLYWLLLHWRWLLNWPGCRHRGHPRRDSWQPCSCSCCWRWWHPWLPHRRSRCSICHRCADTTTTTAAAVGCARDARCAPCGGNQGQRRQAVGYRWHMQPAGWPQPGGWPFVHTRLRRRAAEAGSGCDGWGRLPRGCAGGCPGTARPCHCWRHGRLAADCRGVDLGCGCLWDPGLHGLRRGRLLLCQLRS